MATAKVNDVTVTRNNFGWPFLFTALKKKNSNDPERYSFVPAPISEKITGRTAQDWLNWIGLNDAAHFSMAKARGVSTLIMKYATEEATPVNEKGEATGAPTIEDITAKFIESMAKLEARGETMKSLTEELEGLQSEMIQLATNLSIPQDEKIARMQEIGERAIKIQEAIEAKKARKATDEEE